MDTDQVKKLAYDLGADLCGIASIERFADAPKGFHPRDIYSKTQSVLVFARRVPKEALYAENCVPYTCVNTVITQEVDRLALAISLALEEYGVENVMIPSDDPYEYWDPQQQHGRAILSLRHAGAWAGLGRLGKNGLLINEKFGNMIQIGAVLLARPFAPDPLAAYEVCPKTCLLCLQSCPVGALNGESVGQKLCRPLSMYTTKKGYVLKKCWECRKVCPHATGLVGIKTGSSEQITDSSAGS